MKRHLVLLMTLALCMPAGIAQEQDDAKALEALQREIQERKRMAELEWLLADLLENGAEEAGAIDLVEQIRAMSSGRSLSLDRLRGKGGYRSKVADSDSESGHDFSQSVRDFRKDMLTRTLDRRFAAAYYKGGTCLRDVMDCINRVDQIYDECLHAGLSWPYCLDLWLDLIGVCEDMADECAPG